jgi:hypothetical protein
MAVTPCLHPVDSAQRCARCFGMQPGSASRRKGKGQGRLGQVRRAGHASEREGAGARKGSDGGNTFQRGAAHSTLTSANGAAPGTQLMQGRSGGDAADPLYEDGEEPDAIAGRVVAAAAPAPGSVAGAGGPAPAGLAGGAAGDSTPASGASRPPRRAQRERCKDRSGSGSEGGGDKQGGRYRGVGASSSALDGGGADSAGD